MIMGKPTLEAKARISAASLEPMDWAQETPAARKASFMAGLSRHSHVDFTLVPGMPHFSRTLAAHMTWASTEASSLCTLTLD